MIIVRCRVSVRKFISVFYVVSKILVWCWWWLWRYKQKTFSLNFRDSFKNIKPRELSQSGLIEFIFNTCTCQTYWCNRIVTGIIGMCSNILGWFIKIRKWWIGFISGAFYYAVAISKVRNCMLSNGGWRSSMKYETPHTPPLKTHWFKIPRMQNFQWKGKNRCALHQK